MAESCCQENMEIKINLSPFKQLLYTIASCKIQLKKCHKELILNLKDALE